MELTKITGEMDGNSIEVRMSTGEGFFAPIVPMGTNVSIPSEKWISENKDSFLAIVEFEGDSMLSPMVIGFYPVKGAKSESFNTTERLLKVTTTLLEQLLKAKVNTMIGPQPFMPDSIQVFNDLKTELDEIKSLILPINR